MTIDKSKFSAEELAQYEALIAKALVPDSEPGVKSEPLNAGQEGVGKANVPDKPKQEKPQETSGNAEPAQKSEPSTEPARKSAPAPELTAALDRLEKLEKTVELSHLSDVAKKYAILGEKEDELANTLYRLQKSDPENYKAYIAVLDKQLEIVNKSGLFAEIGKSGSGSGTGGGTVLDRIEAAAGEIQKADPTLNRVAAIAKAWDNNPELVIEYDKEYSKGA